jgi:hypothetical protein
MRDIACAQKLLCLFTSSDRAEGIAGDLAEERREGGVVSFWLRVLSVTFALWRAAFLMAPLATVRLCLIGCALFAGPALAGIAAVAMFPQFLLSPLSWIAMSLFWWSGALFTGIMLVRIAPARGMVACVALASTSAMLVSVVGMISAWYEPRGAQLLPYYAVAMLATIPLVAGGILARGRTIGAAQSRRGTT